MDINKEIDNIITLQYNENKNANIGDVCKCPICGRLFTKVIKEQAFCVIYNHACKNHIIISRNMVLNYQKIQCLMTY